MPLSTEQRLTRLEDYEAIKVVIATFARGADAGCDPAILRPIFTDDAVFDIGQFGSITGGDEIARQMHENADIGFNWTLHFLVSPIIEISEDDLDSAQVFYYLWEAATHRRRDGVTDAYWIGGWYDARMVREADRRWRIRELQLTLKLLSPYGEGWRDMPASFDDLG